MGSIIDRMRPRSPRVFIRVFIAYELGDIFRRSEAASHSIEFVGPGWNMAGGRDESEAVPREFKDYAVAISSSPNPAVVSGMSKTGRVVAFWLPCPHGLFKRLVPLLSIEFPFSCL